MEFVIKAYLDICRTAVETMERDTLTMSGDELEESVDGIYHMKAHMAFSKNLLKAFQEG